MSTQAKGGYEYFITFTDDYSRYGYVYLMKQKSEDFEKFKEFRAEVENQLGKCIKAIRFDHGGKYLLEDFKDYLTEKWYYISVDCIWNTTTKWCSRKKEYDSFRYGQIPVELFDSINFFLEIYLKYCNVSSEFNTFEVYS